MQNNTNGTKAGLEKFIQHVVYNRIFIISFFEVAPNIAPLLNATPQNYGLKPPGINLHQLIFINIKFVMVVSQRFCKVFALIALQVFTSS